MKFTDVLANSLCAELSLTLNCTQCNTYASATQQRRVNCMPRVLALDTHINSEKDIIFWKMQYEVRTNTCLYLFTLFVVL